MGKSEGCQLIKTDVLKNIPNSYDVEIHGTRALPK